MPRKRAVVFDLDGTLVDSLPLVLKAFAHAIEPFGPRPEMDIFARLGGPPDRVIHTLLDDAANVPAAIARLVQYNQGYGHLADMFAGAGDAVAALRAAGARLAIWTGRDRGTTLPMIERHELARWFDAIVCGDDFPTHKPDPEGLRDILRQLGVPADEALLIGDADVDILGGAACGMETILITHGRVPDPAVLAKATHAVATPAEAFAVALSAVGAARGAPE